MSTIQRGLPSPLLHSVFPAVIALGALVPMGCKDTSTAGHGSFDAQNAAYGERTATNQMSYRIRKADGTVANVKLGRTGETKAVGGKTYDVHSYGVTSTSTPNTVDKVAEWWASEPTPGNYIVSGGSKGASGGVATTGTLDEPITVSLTPEVGAPQNVKGGGSITPSSKHPSGGNVQGTGQYTLVEKDVAVATAAGTIYGVSHFKGSGTLTGDILPAEFRGKAITGEVFYHPSFGIVAASSTEAGWSTAMSESSDCGVVDSEGYRIIRKVGVVEAGHEFKLDSFDCAGNQFDADKFTHAAMLLELRWADDAKAKANPVKAAPSNPMLNVEFGTAIGIFDFAPNTTPISVFHPAENGKGIQFWYAYVNQAAKNEPGSGPISYHIRVRADSGLSPVRATARVYYKVAH